MYTYWGWIDINDAFQTDLSEMSNNYVFDKYLYGLRTSKNEFLSIYLLIGTDEQMEDYKNFVAFLEKNFIDYSVPRKETDGIFTDLTIKVKNPIFLNFPDYY